ncbi:sulfatase-like hydrolase/transferase [Tateyamaria omphalii]|uniref:sulfatase-like hydrolase/transferase n=1 Tax=Tateyamaria omphalii TaxID=299262 RepID=UPI001C994A04|nr:sulfatase-like hydrolase/transferase [Tateyamaria omphalii]MBY5933948.1 sulfatase-like hydrolase/transferase [Tateyamaria omphalii]
MLKRTLTAWLVCTLSLGATTATAQQPNVLLVIADDMGLDASACYTVGNQQAAMPTLERLCSEGLVFENAYAYPTCSPTRAALMTGRYAAHTGIGGVVVWNRASPGLSTDEVSLFDIVTNAGYAAALFGKWHIGTRVDGFDHPAALGVPEYFGPYTGALKDYGSWTAIENGEEVEVTDYATSALTDRAIDWIGGQDNPWFLWLAYNAPHAPFHVPPAELLGSAAGVEMATNLSKYQAMLTAMDTEFGRLLDSLDAETRANTVVIFIGDNGSPNQVARDLYAPNGAKGSLYEGGIHVPMIVSGPGITPGRTDALVQVNDIHATIAAMAGGKSITADAFDISSVLGGGEGPRDTIFVEHFSDAPPRGSNTYGWIIRSGNDKLVMIDGQDPQLFDLSSDPLELKDRLTDGTSQEEAARIAELTAKAEAARSGD